MRITRVIAVLGVLAASLVGVVVLGPRLTQYSRFQHRGDAYYSELARACDALIAEHPLATNSFVELSGTDPSLAEIIRQMQPVKIKVVPHRVWILHGGSTEFGIAWAQDEIRTNTWSLSTICEDDVKILYVASRPGPG